MKLKITEPEGVDPVEYMKDRGYVSYSSLKTFRDGGMIVKKTTDYFDFGTELHSRFLEGRVTKRLAIKDEQRIEAMLNALNSDALVKSIMKTKGVAFEQELKVTIQGVPVLGYLDVKAPKLIADLKTTQHKSKTAFINSMDFLQAAVYISGTGIKDFYYIGICKSEPHNVFTFNVKSYPDRMKTATIELNLLLKQIHEKRIFNKAD